MTLPCGHTPDEHDHLVTRLADEAREDFTAWLRDTVEFDPVGWPDALIEMADIMVIGKMDRADTASWQARVASWPVELLVQLIGMAATAMSVVRIRNRALLSEGERLEAMPAATMMHFAMARQLGDDDLTSPLAMMIENLTPWERFVAVHFGSSALKTMGMGAPDLLDLVECITPPTDAG